LVETKSGVILITASDSEQWLSLKCPIVSYDGDVRFCVPSVDFLKAVDNLGDVLVTMSLDDSTHTMTCDYGNGKFSMPYENADEFPLANMDKAWSNDFIIDGKKVLKAIELTGCVDTQYSLEGQLLGHLVIGAMEIEKAAEKLGYTGEKEVLYLEHMLVSHHGLPQFGAAKKPMTAEALCLWHIDTIDSKFRTLGEVLEETESETYTDAIGVLDRSKVWKI
jgi:hypothetical protein